MDKTKAKVIALVVLVTAPMVYLGYCTFDQWAGLVRVMFGAA